MAGNGTGVSRRAYAKSRKISEATVRKYLDQGKLSDALLPDGTLDAEKADRLLAASITRDHQPVELKAAKARRLRAKVRRLGDEVRDLEKSLVRADRVGAVARVASLIVADTLGPIAERMAPIIAEMNGKDAHLALRNAVSDALEVISSAMVTAGDGAQIAEEKELELDALGEPQLLAVQANLQADKLELGRALDKGILRRVADAVEEHEEKMVVSKSLMLAMPGRVAPYAQSETAEQLRARISQEIEHALAAGPPLKVDDAHQLGGGFRELAGEEILGKALLDSSRAINRPPPRMSVPDWADTYRHLSTSAGAVGGPWQTHRVEVARGPMMAVTEPAVDTITIMCCTQTMKTSVLENTLGYFAHLDPAPMLVLQPKDEMADAFSKERIAPMIASSPALRAIMGDHRTRTGADTLRFKKFPGGFLAMASAGSPSNLAMRAIRIVLLDEIDKYETSKEGDPVALAEERTATFTTNRLSIRACSPTWEETSRIYKSYVEGDQRKPFVDCPHCGHSQVLDFFEHVRWNKNEDGSHRPETAHIHCESCGAEWSEAERMKIVSTKYAIQHRQTKAFHCCGSHQDPLIERRWEWDDEHQIGYAICKECGRRGVPNRHASFWASKLYSPFISVVGLVEKWLSAQDDQDTKQTFYNTQLGVPFKAETHRAIDAHLLAARAEPYDGTKELPEGVVVLTAGIDVQSMGATGQGRLEVEVVGWGIGEESWSIAIAAFEGDPASPEVWSQLDQLLLSPYKHALGFNLYIAGACVDSGGHNAQDVYRFVQDHPGRNIWAIKGTNADRGVNWSPIWPDATQERYGHRQRTGYRPIIIGVNAAKWAVHRSLLVDEPGPGYCHFPVGRPDNWYHQLTSEELLVDRKDGVEQRRWRLKKRMLNEALDCRVYAYAALHGLYQVRRLDLEKQAASLFANPAELAQKQSGTAGAAVQPRRRTIRQSLD
ncbi:MAG: phage terminase large subunit family protein [Devosia sp.]|uniref:phage terminase large subunit family protein n=1 Tax=Devosia sp. 66-22 TaxID=1895753 RepID=UPI000ABDF257|nr:terminase gpA endonuclease subunit [Devosia sp. 66-22]MBN9348467.1 phage terminase large subunit family protein [Devosia sp.]